MNFVGPIGRLAILAVALGCSRPSARDSTPVAEYEGNPAGRGVQFAEVSAESGLAFSQVSGSLEQRYILEAMSGGVAFLDYDGDQYLDVFAVNSTRVGEVPERATNRLYKNVGAIGAAGPEVRRFQEVTEEAGLKRTGWGMGCAVGDYDNDADEDIYITYWGPNALYRNDGEGHFSDVTEEAKVGDPGWGTSAAFGDMDGDGDLDLYATNYVVFDLAAPPGGGKPCRGWKGLETFCGPHGMEAQADVLYRNDGEGRFTDVSEVVGISRYRYPGLGVVFTDFDDDGDQDIYVANDSEPNLLYRNDGNWRLTEIGALAGVAYSEEGRAQAGMGVDSGDYDNDGDLDLFVTNFSDDVNTLYQNQDGGSFVDATYAVGLGGEVRPYLGWSTAFFDYDDDGWLDLFVANGHLYPQLEAHPLGLRYAQRNLLYRNEGGRFRQVTVGSGSGLAVEKVSRGTAFGDYDNDGDVDLLVMNLNDSPTLLRNDGGNRNNWLGLELIGVESNRDALGSRVRLLAGSRVQVREVKRGYGYLSQHDGRVLFGLGEEDRVDRVEIRWPAGQLQVLEQPELRRYLVVREGSEELVASYARPAEKEGPLTMGNRPAREKSERESESRELLQQAEEASWAAEDYYRNGVELYEQGRYEEAVWALRSTIRLRPDYAKAYYSLGVVLYSGLGRYEEAARFLEQAVEQDSSQAETYQLVGKVYLSLGQPAKAIQALERATALKPSAWENHHWLGLAHLRCGQVEAATAAFQHAARAAPFAPVPHLHLARIYEKLGQQEAAQQEHLAFERLRPAQEQVEAYLQQLKEDPDDPESHYRLGRAYLQQGRYSEASGHFQRAIELDPRYGLAHYGLGAVYHLQGRLEEAIEAYTQAYRADSSLVMALNDLGRAYHQTGRLEEAIAAYQKAIRLRPDLALARSNLGEAYAAQGRRQEAIASFQVALDLDSTLVETRSALGLLYAAEGHREAAIREWEKVLRLAPEHPVAKRWIRRIEY